MRHANKFIAKLMTEFTALSGYDAVYDIQRYIFYSASILTIFYLAF